MIDKAIGVIPPRNELNSFSDKKTENLKETKSEFEGFMTRLKKEDSDRSLGGTKKKVADQNNEKIKLEKKLTGHTEKTKKENEDKKAEDEGEDKKVKNKSENSPTVLNSMASPESANRTPDTEENLDVVEEKSDVTIGNDFKSLKVSESVASLKGEEALTDNALVADLSFEASPLLQAQMPLKDEAAVSLEVMPQVSQPAAVEVSQTISEEASMTEGFEILPTDEKVLEALNREKLFQKLEGMKQEQIAHLSQKEDKAQNVKAEALTQTDKANTFELSSTIVSAKSEKHFEQNAQSDEQIPMQEKSQASIQPTYLSKDFSSHVADTHHAESATPSTATNDPNVKEILSQARYLVTQGGGEVSVKMTPEGMGEVQLKVMLDNGRMSVELNTHDKSVQKLIQDSLSDLKSSLAAHQISVDHVTLNNKINSVETLRNSNESQNFADSKSFSDGSANQFANPQQSHHHNQRQPSSTAFNYESVKAVPLAKTEINKASAQRVYQMNKAQTLNAVA